MPTPKILTPCVIDLKKIIKGGLVLASFVLESSVGVTSSKTPEKLYTYKISMKTHAGTEKSYEILNVLYCTGQYYLLKYDKDTEKYNSNKITDKELVNYIAKVMRNNAIFFFGKEVEDIKYTIFLYLDLDPSLQSKKNKKTFEGYLKISAAESSESDSEDSFEKPTRDIADEDECDSEAKSFEPDASLSNSVTSLTEVIGAIKELKISDD